MARRIVNLDPPASCLASDKWYLRCGGVSLVVCDPLGPISAAMRLCVRAIEQHRVSQLGGAIEGSQDGFCTVIFRRDTAKFLRSKFGVSAAMFCHMVAREETRENA